MATHEKGGSQGSAFGPPYFFKDIINELQGVCSSHNYADDNTICCSHSDRNILKKNLEKTVDLGLKWFEKIIWKQTRKVSSYIIQV